MVLEEQVGRGQTILVQSFAVFFCKERDRTEDRDMRRHLRRLLYTDMRATEPLWGSSVANPFASSQADKFLHEKEGEGPSLYLASITLA
jgi:hypothetical protein